MQLKPLRYHDFIPYIWQGNFAEAEPLYARSLEILERTLGSDHPDPAIAVSNRAVLLHQQVRMECRRGRHGMKALRLIRHSRIEECTLGNLMRKGFLYNFSPSYLSRENRRTLSAFIARHLAF